MTDSPMTLLTRLMFSVTRLGSESTNCKAAADSLLAASVVRGDLIPVARPLRLTRLPGDGFSCVGATTAILGPTLVAALPPPPAPAAGGGVGGVTAAVIVNCTV